jgi:GcrA cell cycle regulator
MLTLPTWTDARVDILTRLWRDGLSASQIARHLGGVTRNAVIGKVYRLGLSGRAAPAAPGARRPKPKAERRLRLDRPAAPCPPRSGPPAAGLESAPSTGTASVVSVRRGQCRWPLGDPLADDFCLCGRPAVRGAYCAPHGAVAYRATAKDHLLRLAGMR